MVDKMAEQLVEMTVVHLAEKWVVPTVVWLVE